MNQEELKKNYILLSKIAKEKKYAQEYLGLLARRGDIGSIRIGKRWYTAREWFLEFLADAEARRKEVKIAKPEIEPAKMIIPEKKDTEKIILPEKAELKIGIGTAAGKAQAEKKEPLAGLKVEAGRGSFCWGRRAIAPTEAVEPGVEERKTGIAPKISAPGKSFRAERKFETVDLRGANKRKVVVPQKIRIRNFIGSSNALRGEKLRSHSQKEYALQERKVLRGETSPNFAGEIPKIPLFQKFAFSAAAVLLLGLVFQAGLVFKDDLKRIARFESGIVAGASDSKAGLSSVKNSSLGYLSDQKDRIRENISLSRVLVRTAVEKSAGNEQ